jgi:transcriptional regulator with XRE-family HTH domain
MKKYKSIGELLIDYRRENQLSQIDFSSALNVDIRTVQRWEKDITLIKPDKEKEIVEATLLPYQLIRNLNAVIPIPTFYDFRIRKYSLTELNNDLPDANWFKDRLNEFSGRTRPIDPQIDMDILKRDLKIQKFNQVPLSRPLIVKAAQLLPELNLIIMDSFNNYSGHCIVLPIGEKAFEQLKDQRKEASQLTPEDLVNYKTQEKPIFFNYDITADCNDNVFYLAHQYLKFFLNMQEYQYEFCSYSMRYDTYELNEQFGLQLLWEGPVTYDHLGLAYHPRFYTGNFTTYFSKG